MKELMKRYKAKILHGIQPEGMLFANEREYFLLKSKPVEGDSWQRDNERVFYVVPFIGSERIKSPSFSDVIPVYEHAREITVCGNYTISPSHAMNPISVYAYEE